MALRSARPRRLRPPMAAPGTARGPEGKSSSAACGGCSENFWRCGRQGRGGFARRWPRRAPQEGPKGKVRAPPAADAARTFWRCGRQGRGGFARRWPRRAPQEGLRSRFKSLLLRHVAASVASLAAAFLCRRALTLLRLLFPKNFAVQIFWRSPFRARTMCGPFALPAGIWTRAPVHLPARIPGPCLKNRVFLVIFLRRRILISVSAGGRSRVLQRKGQDMIGWGPLSTWRRSWREA